jgi:nucleoporin NUP82
LPGDGGDTADILYLAVDDVTTASEDNRKRRLGVLIIANQDGQTNVCLDLEKVEARWDTEVSQLQPGIDFNK